MHRFPAAPAQQISDPAATAGGATSAVVGAAAAVASIVAPGLGTIVAEVAPEVYLLMGIIKAHLAASKGQFPTPEQVQAGYAAATSSIQSVWANWTPSGR